jgi:hypothetical protein
MCCSALKGVELIGLAIHIEIGAREIGFEQRHPHVRGAAKEFINEGVFGLADCQPVELRHRQEALGIIAA